MKTKLWSALIIIGLNNSAICNAQIDTRIVQGNPHWHIVQGSPSSVPIKLGPSNVPIQFIPLTNGYWAWTTNVEEWWQGIWKEDTNGWRTQLTVSSNSPWLTVEVGSVIRDADGCFTTPNGKFARFDLLDSNGHKLSPKQNAGTNLLKTLGLFYPTNLPAWAAPSAGSLAADFPQTTSTNLYPRYYQHGDLACRVGFISRGGPVPIAQLNLHDLYSISREDDYTLVIQPILYSQHIARLTLSEERLRDLLNQGLHIAYYKKDGIVYAETNLDNPILYRRDFPCVTAKIHLIPNNK